MPKDARQRVKTVCTEDGFEDLWIEYDASSWGIGTYNYVYGTLRPSQLVTDFVPRYSVAWHMRNQDGTIITHPGKDASKIVWSNIWNQFDVATGRAIQRWLIVSVLVAIEEAGTAPSR